jgi:hypothetical protein
MKKSMHILLIALNSFIVSAQYTESAAEKYLKFHAGYQKRMLLDEQKSALTYSSGEITGGLSFTRNASASIMIISLDAGFGNFLPKNPNERWSFTTSYDIEGKAETDSFLLTSGIISAKFQLSYLRKFNTGNQTTWLTGASAKEILIYPDNYTGLLNSIGIHLNVGMLQNIGNRNRFQVNVSFPVLSINTRLPWHNTVTSPLDPEITAFFKKGTRIVSLNKFRMLELSIDYTLTLSRHWGIGASYEFSWLNVPYYQPMKSFMNTARIQTVIKF